MVEEAPWRNRDKEYGKTFENLSSWTFARKQQLLHELEFKRCWFLFLMSLYL